MEQSYFYYQQRENVPPSAPGQQMVQHSSPPRRRKIQPQSPKLPQLHSRIMEQDPTTFSKFELVQLLNKLGKELKKLNEKNREENLPLIAECIVKISRVDRPILTSVSRNYFFTLTQTLFIDILKRWLKNSSLDNIDLFTFRALVKFVKKLVKGTDNVKLFPAWLSDEKFLDIVADCLNELAASKKLFEGANTSALKSFITLMKTYNDYQDLLSDDESSNNDKLKVLVNPIVKCLKSSNYVDTFTNVGKDKKTKHAEKFFLIRCPSFFTSYHGSNLEELIKDLLPSMLPKYITIFENLIPSVNDWKKLTFEAVNYLLLITNYGADEFETHAKLIAEHLPLIDHILKLIDQSAIYDKIEAVASNQQTTLMETAMNFFVNLINESTIVSHIRQARVAPVFLRLASCRNEQITLQANNLLAYASSEDDIKSMKNPGKLLKTNIKSIQTALSKSPKDQSYMAQLLETLKGLVQHDQIKEEVIKQNTIPFLLKCTNKVTDKAHALLLEILWSLSFNEEGAKIIRGDSTFLEQIKTASKETENELLKKTVDGLTWKLVDEPALLERRAKQKEEKPEGEPEMITVTEEIVKSDGTKEIVTVTKPAPFADRERQFQYDMMISYCHADKELVYKIHKFLLDQGFRIWIDLNNMFGPAMSAMADAVENSEFVLLCMSDSYKRSTYCQAEAEYAFGCKRRLVPLIVRPGYRADGWLGFMIGSRIYIDYGAFDFDTACQKLVAEISRQSQRPLPSKATAPESAPEKPPEPVVKMESAAPPEEKQEKNKNTVDSLATFRNRKASSNFSRKDINDWKESDVLDFLFSQKLVEFMPLCEMFDGRTLIKLYKVCKSQTTQTYAFLNDELTESHAKKLPFGVYIRFVSIMERELAARRPPPAPRPAKKPSKKRITPVPKIDYSNDLMASTSRSTVSYFPYQHVSYTPNEGFVPRPQNPTQFNEPYDLLVTSDVPSIRILRAVERYGPNLPRMQHF